MRYDSPQLAERLAVDYVLGLMPPRAQRRFERAAREHATIAATVGAWGEQLAPLDAMTADETPPAHVWRRIERRIGAREARPAPEARRAHRVHLLRRVFAAAAIAAGAVLVVYAALGPALVGDAVDTVAARIGLREWRVSAVYMPADIGLSTMRLGVAERERPRWARAALLLTDAVLPITAAPLPQP